MLTENMPYNVDFTETLTELTLNLFSGGDFRRYPEITISSSSIFVMNRSRFSYAWEFSSICPRLQEFAATRFNTEVTSMTERAEESLGLVNFNHVSSAV